MKDHFSKSDKKPRLVTNESGLELTWMTTIEAAEYLRTTPKQIRNWVYQGKIRTYKLFGRSYRFRRTDLDSCFCLVGGNYLKDKWSATHKPADVTGRQQTQPRPPKIK